jgi:hypothetical protein
MPVRWRSRVIASAIAAAVARISPRPKPRARSPRSRLPELAETLAVSIFVCGWKPSGLSRMMTAWLPWSCGW